MPHRVEVLDRGGGAGHPALPDRLGLPAVPDARGRGRRHPGVDGEETVLVPRFGFVELDALAGERVAVAADPLRLMGASQLGGDRAAQDAVSYTHAGPG